MCPVTTAGSAVVLTRLSGTATNQVYQTYTSTARIVFTTDGSVTSSGWQLSYRTVGEWLCVIVAKLIRPSAYFDTRDALQ